LPWGWEYSCRALRGSSMSSVSLQRLMGAPDGEYR
jgi:hypothetical protein